MGSSRKAKHRRKNTHTTVKVGLRKKQVKTPRATVLPGTDTPAPWSETSTRRANYAALGLAENANDQHGRHNPVRKPPAPVVSEPPVGALAVTDGEAMRQVLGLPLARGVRPPRQLTATQTRVLAALVAAHGSDVEAMARDRKLNALQHTPGTLRVMLTAFTAYAGKSGGGHGFRAPVKRTG